MADNSFSGFTAPQADVEAAKNQTGFVAPESDSLLGHIRSKSVDELYADKTFRPDITLASIGAHNLAPEDVDKLTEVYRRQAEDGFDWTRVPHVLGQIPGAVKDFVKGGVDVAKRVPVVLDPSATANPIARTKAAAELAAAVESGSVETAGLIKSGARKIGDLFKLGAAAAKVAIHGDGPTAEEIYQEQNPQSKYKERLFQAAAEHDQQQKTYGAKGEIAKAIGLDADKLAQAGIAVDEDAINRMSDWGDVSNLTAIGAGWGVVAKTGKPLFVATTKEAAESFSKRLGEKVAAAGRGITGVGQKLSAVRSGEAGALAAAVTTGSLGTGALIGASVPIATKAAGKIVEGVGEKIAKGPGPVLRLGGSAAKGAAAGVVATVPFAAAADYEEDAALIAGVGGGLGATSAAAHHGLHTATQAAQGGAHAVAARAFRQAAESAPIAEHPAYGSNPELDADHAQAMEALRGVDPGTANLVDHIRTVLPALVENAKPGSKPPEVYLLEDSAFKKHFADTAAETQQGVFDHANNRIFLRLAGSDVESLHHEPGHLVFELLPQEQQQSVFNEIKKAYGEDGIKDFTQKYENWVNKDLPPEQHKFYGENYILTEIAAEHLASIIRGDKLDGTSPSLVRALGEKATRMFEVLGLYKPETDAKPNGSNVTQLGIGVSPAVTETLAPFFRENIQSPAVKEALIAPAPAPASSPSPAAPIPTPAPAAPAVVESKPASALPQTEPPKADLSQSGLANPGNFVAPEHEVVEPAVAAKENIRVSPQEQATLDVAERPDLNIAEAEEATSSMSDKTKEVFRHLRESLRAPQGQVLPVEITYNSKEVIQDPTNRTTRREDQANNSNREAVQKLIVPTGFTPDGKQLTAMSPDKVLSNAERIAISADKKGVSNLIPYETKQGTYTPESKAKFNKDLEAYLSNQAAGYRGNGKALVRPENFEGFIPPQNPNYKPTILPDNVANFLNLIMGIAPPKTNRVRSLKGVPIKPTNVRARELATANLRIAQKPGVIGDPTKQNFKDFGNVEIAEFNPLRKALDEAGVNTRSRIEVTERLNLDQIEAVTPRSKSNFRAPVTDLISAGFMPDTDVSRADIKAFREHLNSLDTGNYRNGRYHQKTRKYGDYLFAQDREKFMVDLTEWKTAKDSAALPNTKPEKLPGRKGDNVDDAYSKLSALPKKNSAVNGRVKLVGGKVSADIVAGPGRADIYEFSSREYRNGNGRRAVAELKAKYGSVGVHDPGEPGSGSRMFWEKMRKEGLVDEMFDNLGDRIRFMPSTKDTVASVEDVRNLSTEEFATVAQNWKGGVTGQAISLGKKLQPTDLPVLQNLREQSREKLGEYKAAKNFEAAMVEATRGQFYRETEEAIRANNGEEGLSIRPKDTRSVAFQPRRSDTVTIDDFKDDSNISKALTRPGWTVLTGTQEALGSGTDAVNVKANVALAAELKEKGYQFVPVDGSYKGVDQGKSFLVTGITPDEALELGKKYKQESILTNEGLVYGDGTHNPVDPAATFIGDLAKEQDFHSQIEGGPAFSLGIDFSKREPLDKKELTFMPGVPKKEKSLKDVKVEAKGTRPKKQKLLPKTWILPDGEVAHSANLHENYLADNSKDLNSRFGTKFADKPDQAEREQALRRGFVRVAYEANSGTMNVEVAENRWNKSTRDSVLSLATDNIGKIDNMRVSLLNDKLEVAKQDFARLFQYSDKKKLEHLPLMDATESPVAGGSDRLFLKALRDDSNKDLSFMPKFFSQLENVVETKVQNSATPEQIRGLLSNPQNGVKADEVKWSGIEEFLAGKEKVSKKELQEFLAGNRLEIHEIVKGDTDIPAFSEWEMDHEATDDGDDLQTWTSPDGSMVIAEDADGSWSYKARGQKDTGFHTHNAAYRALLADVGGLEQPVTAVQLNRGDTKFEKYTLPGGKNYRETLFTLPPKRKETAREIGNRLFGGDMSIYDRPAEQQKKIEAEVHGILDDVAGATYRSLHWDEKNVLAHTRTAEHKTADGKSVLLAEEIQSDWHQEGRKKGYSDSKAGKEFQAYEAELMKKYGVSQVFELFGMLKEPELNRYDELERAAHASERGVPDAPFKNTWHEFVFKNLLHEAVDQGKDFLAWTPGELQAERYDLSQQVDKVVYFTETHELRAFKNGQEVIRKDATPEELPDIIGKEAAEKIINSPTEKTPAITELPTDATFTRKNGKYWVTIPSISDQYIGVGDTKAEASADALGSLKRNRGQASHTLSGVDLEVGGKGMRGFYDDILVKFANKYAKKWGANVAQIVLGKKHRFVWEPPSEDSPHWALFTDGDAAAATVVKNTSGPDYLGSNRFRILDSNGDLVTFAKTLGEAKALAESEVREEVPSQVTVHAVPITKAMRAGVEAGQPRFMPAATETKPMIQPRRAKDLSGVTIRASRGQNSLGGVTIRANRSEDADARN